MDNWIIMNYLETYGNNKYVVMQKNKYILYDVYLTRLIGETTKCN